MKPTELSYSEACPQAHKLARTAWDFTTQGMSWQGPTQIQGECTTLPPIPHPLLLPIWNLHSLAHHIVVSQLTKALRSSSLCSSKCTTAQETAGASCSGKPDMEVGHRKNAATLLTGRSPGAPDCLQRPEWQEHLPKGYRPSTRDSGHSFLPPIKGLF